MEFATATPGSEGATISPLDENAGEFVIQGQPNTTFQIQLPDSIQMSTGQASSAEEFISVSNFDSYPQASGTLNSEGQQVLQIGATHAPIKNNQKPGNYQGSYTVTVVY